MAAVNTLDEALKIIKNEGINPTHCKEYENLFLFSVHPKGDPKDPFYRRIDTIVEKSTGRVRNPDFFESIELDKRKEIASIQF